MIILFPFLYPPPTPFFETTEFIALHFTRARLSRSLGTSFARSSLIMNGLFIVAAAHVWHFLRFHCVSRRCARGTQAGLPFCDGKKNALWSVLPAIMVRAGGQPTDVRREFDGAVLKDSTFRAFVHRKGIANLLLFQRGMSISQSSILVLLKINTFSD